jgi:hypothetical protein
VELLKNAGTADFKFHKVKEQANSLHRSAVRCCMVVFGQTGGAVALPFIYSPLPMLLNNSFSESRNPTIKLFYAAFTNMEEHRLCKSERLFSSSWPLKYCNNYRFMEQLLPHCP